MSTTAFDRTGQPRRPVEHPRHYLGRPDPSWKTKPGGPKGWYPETYFDLDLADAVGLFGVERRIPPDKAYEAAAEYLDEADATGFHLRAPAEPNRPAEAVPMLHDLVVRAAIGRGTPMNEAAAYTAAKIRGNGAKYGTAVCAAVVKIFELEETDEERRQ